MTISIFWFRNDLRLHDNLALARAIEGASQLLPVYCHDPAADATTRWDFARVGMHRRHFVRTALEELRSSLRALGSDLFELHGSPSEALPRLAHAVGAKRIVAESIEAPEELAVAAGIRTKGFEIDAVWQSSMLDPDDLPFTLRVLPDVFTAFRNKIERNDVLPPAPIEAPASMPPLPSIPTEFSRDLAADHSTDVGPDAVQPDERSSFPYYRPAFHGGEPAALAHLKQYLDRKLVQTYKTTRNGLYGVDYSSKFSPWLAIGALSARTVYAELKRFETAFGANESTYWLWFELLWRDYFRMLHLKYGKRLYHARGLSDLPAPKHDTVAFQRWCRGETSEPFIDAGMRELATTGYLSNRLRQNVASYLVHDLNCDWRAGCAWFEASLLDYDVYSNQGNWLYVSGRGTDPRSGRRFNPKKQAQDYDADGVYRALWRA